MTPALDRALEAASRVDWETALEAVVTAWQASRGPRLAALVARISPLTIPSAMEGGRPTDVHARWLDRARGAGAATRGRLLATVLDATGSPQVCERLHAMASWPDDPRVVDRAFELLEACPFRHGHASSGRSFERDVVALLAQIDDPRSLPRAEPLHARTAGAEEWHPEARVHRELGPRLATLSGFRVRVAPGPTDTERLEAIEALVERAHAARRAESARGETLLAAIYADPADDALRAVYADWLADRGDPRGELVALQLRRTGKASPRERELLGLHAKQWLGPLAGAVLKEGQRWERGFLTACVFGPKTKAAFAAADGHPSLATVEEIELRTWNRKGDAHPFLASPVFRSLHTVRGLREEAVLEALGKGGFPHVRLRTLGFELQRAERRTQKAAHLLAALAAFPHLERVELVPHRDAPAEAEALAAKMTHVRVTIG